MARIRQLGTSLLFAALALQAQRPTNVAQLTQFIKSAVQLHQPDKQVADTVKSFKLTERLDADTIEGLQSLGAGPQTVAALKNVMTATATLPVAGPPPPPAQTVTIPPPSAVEQKSILAEATKNAVEYTEKLPNFICSQITRRQFGTGNGAWHLSDTIHEQLSFVDHKESYKVVSVNNLPTTTQDHEKLGGVTSSGEFGSMLFDIFKPETETQFDWDHWATLRGRRMHVFSFRVRQTRSEYRIHDGPTDRTTIAGYHGLIYVDAESKMVMRIKMDCDGLEDFPVSLVSIDLNYDTIEIGGSKYVLPLRASLESKAGREASRNDVEFRLYQKFETGATIIFDVPDELTQDQLEEKPVQPAAPPPAKPASGKSK